MENDLLDIGAWSEAANHLSEGLSDITLEDNFQSYRQSYNQHAYDRRRPSASSSLASDESESHFPPYSMPEPTENYESSGLENGNSLPSSSLSFLSLLSVRGRLEVYLEEEQRHEQLALGIPFSQTSEYRHLQPMVPLDLVENGRNGQLQSPVSLTSSKELVQWGSAESPRHSSDSPAGNMSISQNASNASQDLERSSSIEVAIEVASEPPNSDEAIDRDFDEALQSLSSSSRSQGKHGGKRRAYKCIRKRKRKYRKTES